MEHSLPATRHGPLHPARWATDCIKDAADCCKKTHRDDYLQKFFIFLLRWTVKSDGPSQQEEAFRDLKVVRIIALVQLSFSYIMLLKAIRFAALIGKLPANLRSGKPNKFLLILSERAIAFADSARTCLAGITEMTATIESTFSQSPRVLNILYARLESAEHRRSIERGHAGLLLQLDEITHLENMANRYQALMQIEVDELKGIEAAFSAGLEGLDSASKAMISGDVIVEALDHRHSTEV